MPTSHPIFRRKLTLALALLCLLLALLFAGLIYEVNADAACTNYTEVSIRGSGVRLHSESTVLLEAIAGWELDGHRYLEAIGRPEYTFYLQTDNTREGRRYLLVYPSRADAESVVVMAYTWDRLFGNHADPDLHNHPNCASGATPRSNIDTLLAAISS